MLRLVLALGLAVAAWNTSNVLATPPIVTEEVTPNWPVTERINMWVFYGPVRGWKVVPVINDYVPVVTEDFDQNGRAVICYDYTKRLPLSKCLSHPTGRLLPLLAPDKPQVAPLPLKQDVRPLTTSQASTVYSGDEATAMKRKGWLRLPSEIQASR